MVFKFLNIASFGRGCLLWFAFLMLLFSIPGKVSSQNNKNILDTLITINFNNQRLKDALEQMEIQTRITFSYKSGLLKEDRIINKYFARERLEAVIKQLIADETISFNSVGRQIYFYIPRNTKFVPIKEEIVKEVQVPVYRDVIIRDTVTLVKYDTIRITNTIVQRDTIVLEKMVSAQRFSYSAFINQSLVNPGYKLKNDNFQMRYDDLREAETNGNASRFGLMGTMDLGDYSLSSGLGFSVFRNKADYNFTSIITDSAKILGYYTTHTKIKYFYTDSFTITIINPDSTKEVIVTYPDQYKDSTVTKYIENIYKKDTVDFNYTGNNRFTYLTIPVYFGWEREIGETGLFFLNAGLLVDFLVSTKGKSLNDSPYKQLVPISDLPLSPVNASVSLGGGYAYKLENDWYVYAKLNYDFQINSSFSNVYPIRKKPRTLGLTVGIWWR